MEIGRNLESGESLLWSGVPRQGVLLRVADAFMIPFSLLWGGFAIFWEATAIAGGAPFFFALFGVPFVLIGLYMIGGRFLVDAKLRASTYYGLTDRRVIIISGLFTTTTNSLPLGTLHDLSVQERKDRTGTVMFGRRHPFAAWYAGMQWPGMGQHQVTSFELIDNAKQVHDQVVEAQRSAV
jgi:hypothetical protein